MHRSLTSTGALAVTAMIDLALLSRSGPVTLAVLCERQEISKSYLDQLFGKLRRGGLVRPTRGPGGGYSLGRDAGAISVADIVLAVDKPSLAGAHGGGAGARSRGVGQCLASDLWAGLNSKLIEWLDAISLEALVDERRVETAPAARAPARRADAPRPAAGPIEAAVPNSIFALGTALSKRRPARALWAR